MATEHAVRIGKRIRQRREQLKAERGDDYTQDGVARQMSGKTTGTALSRWERGEHQPTGANLEELARVLDVDVSYFYTAPVDGEEAPTATPDLTAALNGDSGLQAEVQELKDMLNDIATAIEGLSTQLEATSEQSAARFESLRAELAKRARRAA